ncbi:hypothetical protein Ga0100231_013925 [Opitutaceae bacterium TAV4]|nr:hypothetical protein Ga0100231_013925 [Opitutaceae bacterium TAV4]
MNSRAQLKQQIRQALGRAKVVALLGPRQCGKTTLAREFVDENSANYFDLEDPISNARLDQPKAALESLSGLVVIDEIQLRPELFPLLRVLADRRGSPATFMILGSASPQLARHSGESLAGRVETIEITPFSLIEAASPATVSTSLPPPPPPPPPPRTPRLPPIQTSVPRPKPDTGCAAVIRSRFLPKTTRIPTHGATNSSVNFWNATSPASASPSRRNNSVDSG